MIVENRSSHIKCSIGIGIDNPVLSFLCSILQPVTGIASHHFDDRIVVDLLVQVTLNTLRPFPITVFIKTLRVFFRLNSEQEASVPCCSAEL